MIESEPLKAAAFGKVKPLLDLSYATVSGASSKSVTLVGGDSHRASEVADPSSRPP